MLDWIVSVALIAAPASAQTDGLKPVEASVFADAARSCAAALSTGSLDQKRLTTDGWAAGTMQSSKGGKTTAEYRIQYRGGVLLMVIDTPSKPANSCTLMARAKAVSDLPSFATHTAKALAGGRVVKSQAGEIIWLLADGKIAQFNTSGSGQRPAARLTIMALAAEKK